MDYISYALNFYSWTLTFADKRVAEWPLINSPFPTIAVVCFYLYFVLYAGPKMMASR